MRKLNPAIYVLIVMVLLISMLSGYAVKPATGDDNMRTKQICDLIPVQRSQKMIQVILDDISSQYNLPGGGGITRIRLERTNVYIVNISQEERIDEITYEMNIDLSCNASILKSTLSAISKNRH